MNRFGQIHPIDGAKYPDQGVLEPWATNVGERMHDPGKTVLRQKVLYAGEQGSEETMIHNSGREVDTGETMCFVEEKRDVGTSWHFSQRVAGETLVVHDEAAQC